MSAQAHQEMVAAVAPFIDTSISKTVNVPQDYPYLLTADWEPPFRARRLAELLARDQHDLAGFAAIQADQLSLLAQDLLPIMLEAEARTPEAAAAQEALAAWDRVMRPDAASRCFWPNNPISPQARLRHPQSSSMAGFAI